MMAATKSKLSIIIPVLNEEVEIAAALARLKSNISDDDVKLIVVDGGSHDRTVEVVRRIDFVTLVEFGCANRGLQMNAGAQTAEGDVFLFLHADVGLPPGAIQSIDRALIGEGAVGGSFLIRFPSKPPFSLWVIERGINFRTRLFHTATGDQAIFVRRDVFETIGGYQGVPLMEDVALFNEVKKLGRVVILDDRVEVSPRRWIKHGVWRTMFLMYAIRLGYWAGVSPATLKRYFVDVR
jgi:rSAM/selenodomain-associated transferase 2